MTKYLTVNRQNDLFLSVNRQRDPPLRPSSRAPTTPLILGEERRNDWRKNSRLAK